MKRISVQLTNGQICHHIDPLRLKLQGTGQAARSGEGHDETNKQLAVRYSLETYMLAGSDAREHQNLRRVHSARADDHLLAGGHHLLSWINHAIAAPTIRHANSFLLVVEHHTCDMSLRSRDMQNT